MPERLQSLSQVPVADWYDLLTANTTISDALLDRFVHTTQRLVHILDNVSTDKSTEFGI